MFISTYFLNETDTRLYLMAYEQNIQFPSLIYLLILDQEEKKIIIENYTFSLKNYCFFFASLPGDLEKKIVQIKN